MTIKIKIEKADVISERIQGKNGAFETRKQEGWVDLPSGERRKVRIRLDRLNGGYAAGEYTIGDGSFFVGEYGDLQIGTPELVKVVVAARVA